MNLTVDKPEYIPVFPVGQRGRQPLWSAKVGTGPGTLIMIQRNRRFHLGQYIKFVTTDDVAGQCIGVTPRWNGGVIDKIEGNRLFIERM